MQSTRPNQPTPGAFYMFVSDMESNRPRCGVRFNNLRQLLSPPCVILRPQEGGFPSMLEQPQMTYDPSAGPEPRDLEPGFGGYWLVSEQLHDVMCSVDPNAFAFTEVDYRLADGIKGPRRFLCDVVREMDALDERLSRLKIKVNDDYVRGKFYSFGGGASLAFRNEVLGQSHVFRLPFNPSVFCDRTFKDAVHEAGIPGEAELSGISFIDASDI
ncbi:DUF1629 domain-containing protein [Xanthomonas floridensis]|uniref:DUF1629 domain-containing protein n=1 Tax=Xanthomonas floridensis TaxID=1843580 RepID=A0A1A9MDL4_9XANT|nr:DUF1629 domain-containing protein [Xanthomonas floridensis]MEA5122337.1 DUF1629 domain-containing protein [Xanthomonas floridensis]MEA5133626.1 DUF1629 domain-containing protein [Xanthomonas floridensis]OAG68139.1 hypothetical protein A7D17_03000 [Xanthomonas floridensis]